jgi:hypothetical protein
VSGGGHADKNSAAGTAKRHSRRLIADRQRGQSSQ